MHALRSLVSSSAHDQVDELTKQFSVLKESFGWGMQGEIVHALLSAGKYIFVASMYRELRVNNVYRRH